MNHLVRFRIEVVCRTNLDGYENIQWPHELPGIPVVGHVVEGVSRSGQIQRRLRIVAITWLSDGRLELELHSP